MTYSHTYRHLEHTAKRRTRASPTRRRRRRHHHHSARRARARRQAEQTPCRTRTSASTTCHAGAGSSGPRRTANGRPHGPTSRVHKARARAARGGCRGRARRGHSGGKGCRWRPRRTRRPESTPRSCRVRRVLQSAQNAQNQQRRGESGQARSLLGRAGASGHRTVVRDELLPEHLLALRGVRRHLREVPPRMHLRSAFPGTMPGEQGCAGRAISSVLFMLTVFCGWIPSLPGHAR